jgi:(p)ppGpp synthase/HD superfamily hydrolase
VIEVNSADLLEKAVSIAVEAHRGQRDRTGAPYILHPMRVMAGVDTDVEKTVAILHDVVEDTDWTFERLTQVGFPKEVIEALRCVTKSEGEEYNDFVKRSASNEIARKVKLADLEHNMDARRLSNVTEKDAERLKKYVRAWRFLKGLD